jgi:hypothetical protein
MKKLAAMMMTLMMMLGLSVTAFAEGHALSLNEAKQAALNYVGVRAAEATFTKANRDWDDGREVYEIEFYANGVEYDMDIDVNTGAVSDFSSEYHGSGAGDCDGYWDDDWYEYDDDDRYDPYDDWDYIFDHDYDLFDWDD